MKYKVLLPLLVSVALLNACSKDENETVGQKDTILDTYYPAESMEIKEIAIYTNNEVITDQAFIKDFLDRNVGDDVKKNFFLGMSSLPVPASSTLLHFLNDNRVNVNGANMQITGYRDSLMLVSEYTSTQITSNLSSCAALSNYVTEYNPYTDCPDGSSCTSYRKTTPLIVNGANYAAPLLSYLVKTENCVSVPNELPAVNIRNHNLQSVLTEKDTVLIQYAKLPLIKKAKDE